MSGTAVSDELGAAAFGSALAGGLPELRCLKGSKLGLASAVELCPLDDFPFEDEDRFFSRFCLPEDFAGAGCSTALSAVGGPGRFK